MGLDVGVAALDVAAEKQEQHEDQAADQPSRLRQLGVSSLGIMLGPTGTDGLWPWKTFTNHYLQSFPALREQTDSLQHELLQGNAHMPMGLSLSIPWYDSGSGSDDHFQVQVYILGHKHQHLWDLAGPGEQVLSWLVDEPRS